MNIIKSAFLFLLCSGVLFGCANDEPLGKSVYILKDEQTYNKNATEDNIGFVPTGSAMKEDQQKE